LKKHDDRDSGSFIAYSDNGRQSDELYRPMISLGLPVSFLPPQPNSFSKSLRLFF
jgi:hypothetical protein